MGKPKYDIGTKVAIVTKESSLILAVCGTITAIRINKVGIAYDIKTADGEYCDVPENIIFANDNVANEVNKLLNY